MDALRLQHAPEIARRLEAVPSAAPSGAAFLRALEDLPAGATSVCPSCGTLSRLVCASSVAARGNRRELPVHFRERMRLEHLCVLCAWGRSPEALLGPAVLSYLWFLIAPQDEAAATRYSQAILTHDLWNVVDHASSPRPTPASSRPHPAEVQRWELLEELAAYAPPARSGEPAGFRLPHEILSPLDTAYLDEFFGRSVGNLAAHHSQDLIQRVYYGQWGVPILLQAAQTEGRKDLALWAGRERFLLTRTGVEFLRQYRAVPTPMPGFAAAPEAGLRAPDCA